MELGRGRKGEKNDKESTMLDCITSVQVEDITICY
jgi:hypothetical protein